MVNKKTVRQSMDVSVPSFILGYKDISTGYDGKELLKKATEYSIILELAFGKKTCSYSE